MKHVYLCLISCVPSPANKVQFASNIQQILFLCTVYNFLLLIFISESLMYMSRTLFLKHH